MRRMEEEANTSSIRENLQETAYVLQAVSLEEGCMCNFASASSFGIGESCFSTKSAKAVSPSISPEKGVCAIASASHFGNSLKVAAFLLLAV